jgi:hypothetical protein
MTRFFIPTLATALPPVLLLAFAVLPVLVLRYTLYSVLSYPLTPIIHGLGRVYQDHPEFLTPAATMLTAAVWAGPLFVIACAARYCFQRQ